MGVWLEEMARVSTAEECLIAGDNALSQCLFHDSVQVWQSVESVKIKITTFGGVRCGDFLTEFLLSIGVLTEEMEDASQSIGCRVHRRKSQRSE